jgi:hypothetical protein
VPAGVAAFQGTGSISESLSIGKSHFRCLSPQLTVPGGSTRVPCNNQGCNEL